MILRKLENVWTATFILFSRMRMSGAGLPGFSECDMLFRFFKYANFPKKAYIYASWQAWSGARPERRPAISALL